MTFTLQSALFRIIDSFYTFFVEFAQQRTLFRNKRCSYTYFYLTLTLRQTFDTIRYNSVYLTCSKKLKGSQLSLPHRSLVYHTDLRMEVL